MSWFYIGQQKGPSDKMLYEVVHEFHQPQQVGNPLAGEQIQIVAVPKLTVDMRTDDQQLAAARCHYLNGGHLVP